MAVFFDIGDGDIYGGPTKKAVMTAIREDIGDENFKKIEDEIKEVSGETKIQCSDENNDPTGELTTIAEEYDERLGAYCVASTNC